MRMRWISEKMQCVTGVKAFLEMTGCSQPDKMSALLLRAC
jgi:hypothetical protein